MTIPVVRKRAKHAKVRSGCRTCKERRVKCDEKRPACSKCEVSGKKCGGYDGPPLRTNTQIELRPKAEVKPFHAPRTFSWNLTNLESYALDYFRRKAIGDLPGSNWLLAWDRLIPQYRTEPAVVHATIALGSLSRALIAESTDQRQDHLQLALVQYNKTIFNLRTCIETLHKQSSGSTAELVLTVCLLLFGFDVLQGNETASFMHLRNGLRILFQQMRSQSPRDSPSSQDSQCSAEKRLVVLRVEPKSSMDILAQTFVRLDADLSLLADDDPYLFPTCFEPLPTTFKSLSEAMVHLDALEREVYDIWGEWYTIAENNLRQERPDMAYLDEPAWDCLAMAYMDIESLSSSPNLNSRVDGLKQALTHFMNALAFVPAADEFDSARALVDIHFFYLWVIVCSWRDRDLMEIDRFEEQFHHIIRLIEQYLERQRQHTPGDSPGSLNSAWKTRPAAAVGTSIGQTLCLIVELCRNSVLRRRGVRLIRAMDMRGVFDSDFLGSYYDAIIDLEENWARKALGKPDLRNLESQQVPVEARIIECDISDVGVPNPYYRSPIGILVYAKLKDAESGEYEAGHQTFNVTRPSLEATESTAGVMNFDLASRPLRRTRKPTPDNTKGDEEQRDLNRPRSDGWTSLIGT